MSLSRVMFLIVLVVVILTALSSESGLWSPSLPTLPSVSIPKIQPISVQDILGWTRSVEPVVKNVPPRIVLPPLPYARPVGCTASGPLWREVWGDEFSQANGDYRWNVITGNPGKNGEIEDYMPSDVYASGGDLVLRTARTSAGGYTSGAVDTNGTFSMRYGKIVIRAKLARGQGLWPGFWLRPADGSLLPEIDIMEVLESAPDVVYMTLHWLSPQGPAHTYVAHQGPDLAAGFHTYTVVWLPGEIDWYLDGQRILHVTRHVPTKPMYLTLDAAVGSSWGGYPTRTQPMPQDVSIDYIRAYEYGKCAEHRFIPLEGQSFMSSGDSRVAVFVLHQVSNANPGPYNITPAVLARDVQFLRDHGVHFMSLRQFLAYERGLWHPHGAWALMTFDDGYSSIYRNAAPILARNHIPAVLFLIGSKLNTETFWLSTSQVRTMAKSGLWAIEAHTYQEHDEIHGEPALVYLDANGHATTVIHDVWREMAVDRSISGKTPYAFAFPFGQDTPRLVSLLSRSYALLFTSKYALAEPGEATIPRIVLGSPKANVAQLWERWFAE